jgi:hypothetical protein
LTFIFLKSSQLNKNLSQYNKFSLTGAKKCGKMRVKTNDLEVSMKKQVPNMIRVLLVMMTLAVLAMAILWTPQVVSYAENQTSLPEGLSLGIHVLAAAISLIALSAFALAFVFPREMEKGTLFGETSARAVGWISWLVLTDCFLLAVGAVGLFVCGERLLSPALAFVDAVGLVVFVMLRLLSSYLREAAELREEVDATL